MSNVNAEINIAFYGKDLTFKDYSINTPLKQILLDAIEMDACNGEAIIQLPSKFELNLIKEL